MHKELHRVLKTFIYKFIVYFPSSLLLAYIFYNDFVKDIGLVGANVIIGIILYYIFEWIWEHKSNKTLLISTIIIWLCLLAIAFTIKYMRSKQHKEL